MRNVLYPVIYLHPPHNDENLTKSVHLGTMLMRKSAKKDISKSTAAVINEVFFYVMLDTKRGI